MKPGLWVEFVEFHYLFGQAPKAGSPGTPISMCQGFKGKPLLNAASPSSREEPHNKGGFDERYKQK